MPGSYDHSPAKVIRQLLINNGLGVEPSYAGAGTNRRYNGSPWPVFYSKMPDDPDGAVQVKDTAGTLTNKRMRDGEMGGMQGIQIMVRGTAHDTAYAKADAIAKHLDSISLQSVQIGGDAEYTVWNVQRSSDPLDLGYDSPDTKRFLFSINATVRMRQEP